MAKLKIPGDRSLAWLEYRRLDKLAIIKSLEPDNLLLYSHYQSTLYKTFRHILK